MPCLCNAPIRLDLDTEVRMRGWPAAMRARVPVQHRLK